MHKCLYCERDLREDYYNEDDGQGNILSFKVFKCDTCEQTFEEYELENAKDAIYSVGIVFKDHNIKANGIYRIFDENEVENILEAHGLSKFAVIMLCKQSSASVRLYKLCESGNHHDYENLLEGWKIKQPKAIEEKIVIPYMLESRELINNKLTIDHILKVQEIVDKVFKRYLNQTIANAILSLEADVNDNIRATMPKVLDCLRPDFIESSSVQGMIHFNLVPLNQEGIDILQEFAIYRQGQIITEKIKMITEDQGQNLCDMRYTK